MENKTNPFRPGDRVIYRQKNRIGGLVKYIGCALCANCLSKDSTQRMLCLADLVLKNKVWVSWPSEQANKLFKYNFEELESDLAVSYNTPETNTDKIVRTPEPCIASKNKDWITVVEAKANIPLIEDDETNTTIEELSSEESPIITKSATTQTNTDKKSALAIQRYEDTVPLVPRRRNHLPIASTIPINSKKDDNWIAAARRRMELPI